MKVPGKMVISGLATLIGIAVHLSYCWLTGEARLTDAIAEWIMARTPSAAAVWLLTTFGAWAKPFAATGALATLGAASMLLVLPGRRWFPVALAGFVAGAYAFVFEYHSIAGWVTFFVPALVVMVAGLWRSPAASTQARPADSAPSPGARLNRRRFLDRAHRAALPVVTLGGVAGVALESYLRNHTMAASAVEPVQLFPFSPPHDNFGEGLVRTPVTPIADFYVMSKNTVDPAIDPRKWTLRITIDDRPWRELSYEELLSLPRQNQYVSLRCVSNTLTTNFMGTALWSGLRPAQLINRAELPGNIAEVAVIGVDGHGDSFQLDYFFADAALLALAMNGRTLDRSHGFPIRLIVPRYYGFKHVKWISDISFRSEPYFGTWPKMGYTKEPVIHTVSFIDNVDRQADAIRLGGIALSGRGGIRQVQVRADTGSWSHAELEKPLSPYTWTRWKGALPVGEPKVVQARAMDTTGEWQADEESPLFPDGMRGPTIRKLS